MVLWKKMASTLAVATRRRRGSMRSRRPKRAACAGWCARACCPSITCAWSCRFSTWLGSFKPRVSANTSSLTIVCSLRELCGIHSKNKAPVLGNALHLFWVWNQNGDGTYFGYKTGLCSAISFERSRRELPIDVAEPRSPLKNYPNTYYPRLSLIPKTGMAFPKTGGCFYCVFILK